MRHSFDSNSLSSLAKEYFAQRRDDMPVPARLTSIEQRAELLFKCGVDHVVCLPFNDKLDQQSAHDFVTTLLIDALATRYLVVGDDFRFGFQRKGDFSLLKEVGERNNFDVVSMQTYRMDDHRVSSGRVRDALQESDFELTKKLLGRVYSIKGNVEKGDQLGQTIGFPTANIKLLDFKLPLKGVFAVQTQLPNGNVVNGVCNIGKRPTVNGKENRLEVHLLDLHHDMLEKDVENPNNKARQQQETEASYDLYGLNLEVFFMRKIRDEIKFNGVVELQAQIQKDVELARRFFAENG